MKRFGKSFERVLFEKNFEFSRYNIYYFAQQVLNILETVHQAGIIYNDLKFDNLLLGFK